MRPLGYETNTQEKTLAICTYTVGSNQWEAEDYEEEFHSLVNTSGFEVEEFLFMRLRTTDSGNFFTKGKLAEVVDYCSKNKIERIILSSSLTSMQHRNLERLIETDVLDRTDLILHIFKNSAVSAEGKLQVEIAELNIKKTRVAGLGKELGQQQFGVGSRGPGETEKEFLYRQYSEEILRLEKKIASLEKSKEVQRKRRLKSGIPLVSLVGYTNAGKSSLLNNLSGAHVLVEDKLFATLDTTTKEVFLAPSKKILLSDTVGFISELPHHLVKAFRSTLDELVFAKLLLHVIDIGNHSWQEQFTVVMQTLSDINVNKDMVLVFNKVDLVDEESLQDLSDFAEAQGLPYVFTSTYSDVGISELKNILSKYA